jgi:hypothetical protein
MHHITVDDDFINIDGTTTKLPLGEDPVAFIVQRKKKGGYLYVITFDDGGLGGHIFKCSVNRDNTLSFLRAEGHNLQVSGVHMVSFLETKYRLHGQYTNFPAYGLLLSGTGPYFRGVRLLTIDHPHIFQEDLTPGDYKYLFKPDSYIGVNYDEFSFDDSGCRLNMHSIKANYDIMRPDYHETDKMNPSYDKGELRYTFDLTNELDSVQVDFKGSQALQSEYEILRFF